MHYDAVANDHGLRHDPFKAIVAPRPIGWISSISASGDVNLAPYSFFNAVAEKPAYVMFSSAGRKDSVRNIEETGEFVCSLATYDLRSAVTISSATVPHDVDEFPIAGLTTAPSRFVKPPRVRESPAALECRLWRMIELPKTGRVLNYMVIGSVLGVYIDERYIHDGVVDTGAMRPIARLGYKQYAVVTPETLFDLDVPKVDASGRIIARPLPP